MVRNNVGILCFLDCYSTPVSRIILVFWAQSASQNSKRKFLSRGVKYIGVKKNQFSTSSYRSLDTARNMSMDMNHLYEVIDTQSIRIGYVNLE